MKMKKGLLILLCMILMPALASDKIRVKSLVEFDTQNPSEIFNVEVIEDGEIDNIQVIKGDVIYGEVFKTTTPTIGKRNAGIYLKITHYEDKYGKHEFLNNLSAKYAKTVISKEEIKKIPPQKIIKKAALTTGDFFVKGLSYGVNFATGMKENTEGNRFQSGLKNMYEESIFSFAELGQEVKINIDDEFYLIIKKH